MFIVVLFFFFFQAEDGIRDRSPSRGLGDVYKRQGKKIKGKKRHILVDTLGLLLSVIVHPADVQDRDGAFQLLRRARRMFPFIERIFADGGYAGPKMALAARRTGT